MTCSALSQRWPLLYSSRSSPWLASPCARWPVSDALRRATGDLLGEQLQRAVA